jgi:hypothetical protein
LQIAIDMATVLQSNLLAEILDSSKRYSLEEPSGRKFRKSLAGKIPTIDDTNIMINSTLAYDADVAYVIMINKVFNVL